MTFSPVYQSVTDDADNIIWLVASGTKRKTYDLDIENDAFYARCTLKALSLTTCSFTARVTPVPDQVGGDSRVPSEEQR